MFYDAVWLGSDSGQELEEIQLTEFDDAHGVGLLFRVIPVVADDAVFVLLEQRAQMPDFTVNADRSIVIMLDDDSFVLSAREAESGSFLTDDPSNLLGRLHCFPFRVHVRKAGRGVESTFRISLDDRLSIGAHLDSVEIAVVVAQAVRFLGQINIQFPLFEFKREFHSILI